MKVAQYKSVEFGFVSIDEVEPYMEEHQGYVRVSEPVEVDFTPLPAGDVVPKQVKALEAAKQEAQEKYLKVIAGLDNKIANLMAIEEQK